MEELVTLETLETMEKGGHQVFPATVVWTVVRVKEVKVDQKETASRKFFLCFT